MRSTAPCSTLGVRPVCQPLPPTTVAAAHRRPCRQCLALVSKRFAAAVCSPELLREADVGLAGGRRALRSLTAWLAHHGQHVQQLCIIALGEELQDSDGVTAIASCLATAGAAGQLERLASWSGWSWRDPLAARSGWRLCGRCGT